MFIIKRRSFNTNRLYDKKRLLYFSTSGYNRITVKQLIDTEQDNRSTELGDGIDLRFSPSVLSKVLAGDHKQELIEFLILVNKMMAK